MLELFIDNIIIQYGGRINRQTAGIPIGTNCASVLAALFRHFYGADFIADLIQKKEYRLVISFNLRFRNIYSVLSLNNRSFVDLKIASTPKKLR